MIQVGCDTQIVETPIGTPMGGFAARTQTSSGVHDPLTVRALVMGKIGIVSVDCCVLHESTCAQIRDASDLDDVIVAATHTHSGASIGCGRVGKHSVSVHQAVVEAAKKALRKASNTQIACDLDYCEIYGLNIAKNRRHFEREVDPPLQCLRFTSQTGQVINTVVSYPCHPVVLDAANTLISGDYPAFIRSGIEVNNPGSQCLFLTGCAGDINTGHRAEDSFTPTGQRKRTFTQAQRIAQIIVDAVAKADWHPINVDEVSLGISQIEAPMRQLSVDELQVDIDSWQARLTTASKPLAQLLKIWISWARNCYPGEASQSWKGRVGVIKLGSFRLVTLPGEPFLEVANLIRAQWDAPAIVLGYCDGVPGYFPVESEYAYGGYEVVDAHRYYAMPGPFMQGSVETIAAQAVALMGD